MDFRYRHERYKLGSANPRACMYVNHDVIMFTFKLQSKPREATSSIKLKAARACTPIHRINTICSKSGGELEEARVGLR